MRRGATIRAAAVLAALVLGLAGCGTAVDRDPGGTPAETTAAEPELSGDLTVYAAASLKAAFDELATQFEQRHPSLHVQSITYDGSSTLATQLVGGASADVFASADEATMTEVAGTREATVFATNTLEIVVAPDNPLGISSLADLAEVSSSGGKVVLCATGVPCGSAARTVLDGAGLALTPVSEEQNVKAVLTKVQTGDADAGLVYRTDVLAAGGTVAGVEFAEASTAVNAYPVAVLAGARDPDVAQAFVDLLLSDRGRAILEDQGFATP